MEELLNWITNLNNMTKVDITLSSLSDDSFWFYDNVTNVIKNKNNSFFHIAGIKGQINDETISHPIIIQSEIGFLGIICKVIENELMFLMQAKIEPGNINCVQISPTLQATKSNFLQLHGGNKPNYLEYFTDANVNDIIVDQIQSEQSSRFYKKRNRNIIIKINNEVEVLPNFKWMTLRQIKELMKYPNLVNMDTRTVLSALPSKYHNSDLFNDKRRETINNDMIQNEILFIYNKINSYKMMDYKEPVIVGLNELDNWKITREGLYCLSDSPFDVSIYDIEIEGREVRKWQQPLFKSNGRAIFGLIQTRINHSYKYIVRITPEIGAFDGIELGPTIQKECTDDLNVNCVDDFFWSYVNAEKNIIFDSILSEEGGRFYHEENRNIVVSVASGDLPELPNDYLLVGHETLLQLMLVNNCLNIQLRNLISTMEVY